MAKKKELAEKYPPIKRGGKILSKEYRSYVNQMGISASIIHLSEVSAYCSDQILLFGYETFILEVIKYDFKSLAEEKEQEALMKEAEIKSNIKHGKL